MELTTDVIFFVQLRAQASSQNKCCNFKFIYTFNKYRLGAYCVSGIVLGPQKQISLPVLVELIFLWGRHTINNIPSELYSLLEEGTHYEK